MEEGDVAGGAAAGVVVFRAGDGDLGCGEGAVRTAREAGASTSFGAGFLAKLKSGRRRRDDQLGPHPSKILCRIYAILFSL